jgi:hypothetical protein
VTYISSHNNILLVIIPIERFDEPKNTPHRTIVEAYTKHLSGIETFNLEEPVRVASPTRINLEEPVRVASPTRINLEEPVRVRPAQPGLTWRNQPGLPSTTRINLEEPVRVHPAQPGLTWRNPSGCGQHNQD